MLCIGLEFKDRLHVKTCSIFFSSTYDFILKFDTSNEWESI